MKSARSNQPRSTAPLCAGAALILALMNLGIEASHAAHDPTLPESLLTQGKLPPEEADGPFHYWNRHKKFFLVIAVNQTDVPKTELPFAQVDGQLLVMALMGRGYQPVDPAHPLLTGKEANASAIMAALDEARKKREDATFIIYYTGHGAVGPKDLWLQTAGQVKVGDGQGIKVSDLVVQVRQRADGKAFEGELVLILDACYSGQGTVSQGLTLGEAGKRTTILTSSTNIQESFSLNPPVVSEQMSAFTYTFLQALGPDWAQADGDHDGMLRWEELKRYAGKQLRQFKTQGALAQPMTPDMFSNYSEGFLAYRRDEVRVWRSSYRDELTTQAMEEILAAHLQRLGASPKDRPALPKEAQLLAQNLEPALKDYYTQAVKATAEGQLENARTLFAKAEAQSQERATHAEAVKQRETEKQGQIYLALARMEMYAGRFTEAFSQYQQAATIFPPSTPEAFNEIGFAGVRAGKYPEAEPYLNQALQQREQVLAPSHPDVALSLNNLALLYNRQGQYAEAEPLYQRAVSISEKALGPDHPSVALSLNNLAEGYQAQGQYAKAEPLFQRALRISEQALGPNHPQVALSLNGLAILYHRQGQYAEAEPLYQRAIAVFETTLGPEHPDLALSLNNLAEGYRAQGQYAKAEPLYQRALRISEQALGPNHPQVAINLNNLALLHYSQGQYAEAEPLYQRVIAIFETTLGPEHPDLALSLNNLAEGYRAQGQYAKAEPLFQRALRISEQALGPNHPQVAINLNNLALLYHAQEKYAEAEPLDQRALAIWEKALGPDHPDVATSLNNLAHLYQAQEKYAEAEPLLQRSFWIVFKSLGPEHPTVRQVLLNYQDFLKASGQPHTVGDAMERLKSSTHAPTNIPPSP